MKVEYLGNQELLQLKKAAFLASSTISSETVLQVYDWATEMRNRGECVVSGFSSKLEQDVLHFHPPVKGYGNGQEQIRM